MKPPQPVLERQCGCSRGRRLGVVSLGNRLELLELQLEKPLLAAEVGLGLLVLQEPQEEDAQEPLVAAEADRLRLAQPPAELSQSTGRREWAGYAKRLARLGYLVIAIDFRGYGAQKVFAVGASMGGTAALVSGANTGLR
jgi:hypothetical protein